MSGIPIRKPTADTIGGGFDGQFDDDELLTFGTDADYSFRYNTNNDRLEIFDDTDDTNILSMDKSETAIVHNELQISDVSDAPKIYSKTDGTTGDELTFVISNDDSISGELGLVVVAPGQSNVGASQSSVLIGRGVSANNNSNSTIIGDNATALGRSSVAIGDLATVETGSVAIGSDAAAEGANGIAIGDGATHYYADSNAIGIGEGVLAGTNAITIGNGYVSGADGVARLGHASGNHVEFNDGSTWHRQFDQTTGSKVYRRNTVSSSVSTSGEEVISVDSSGGAVTLTLSSGDAIDGKKTMVKRNGANSVTIETEGSETIDDGTSFSLGADNDSVTLVYNSGNTDWEVF